MEDISFFAEVFQKIKKLDESRLKEEANIRSKISTSTANIDKCLIDNENFFKRLNLQEK